MAGHDNHQQGHHWRHAFSFQVFEFMLGIDMSTRLLNSHLLFLVKPRRLDQLVRWFNPSLSLILSCKTTGWVIQPATFISVYIRGISVPTCRSLSGWDWKHTLLVMLQRDKPVLRVRLELVECLLRLVLYFALLPTRQLIDMQHDQ